MTIDVRVMGDLGGWPLWTDEESTQSPDEWPMLSDELKAKLQAWNQAWTSTKPEQTTAQVRSLVAEAGLLVGQVQAEVGAGFNVRLDL